MTQFKKILAAALTVSLAGAPLVGCGAQPTAQTSAQTQTSAEDFAKLSLDEQLEELGKVVDKEYKSVTMETKSTIKVDLDAMLSGLLTEDEDASTPDTADGAATADDESEPMTVDVNASIKYDMSGEKAKMYMSMETFGTQMEIYLTGEEAVMVMGGEAYSGSLEELGMSDYASPETYMNSQGADVSKLKDSVTEIKKEIDGDEAIYKVTCDAAKYLSSDAAGEAISSLSGLDSVNFTYRVGKDGYLSEFTISIEGKGYGLEVKSTLSDYDKTTVPDAPEATKKYSDIMSSLGGLTDLLTSE